ncbi:unnamed protein product [Rhizophagus irregularis]|nr:unnamed protein product [Rhizophagus irregularis]
MFNANDVPVNEFSEEIIMAPAKTDDSALESLCLNEQVLSRVMTGAHLSIWAWHQLNLVFQTKYSPRWIIMQQELFTSNLSR